MWALATSIDGLARGQTEDKILTSMAKAAEVVEEICLPMLEEMSGRYQTEGSSNGLYSMSLNTSPDTMGDWDFMVSE